MADVFITAKVGPMDVSTAARSCGFPGYESRATVIRYTMLRAIGYSDEEAREKGVRKKIESGAGMKVTGGLAGAKIDAELLEEIESKWPEGITNRSMFMRYSLFIASGYDRDEALEEAHREPGRPPRRIAGKAES
jgi:hypothetical protein